MSSHEPLADEPARLEREIVHTRESLHRKLDELQHRLDPREQVRAKTERVKSAVQNVDPTSYAGVAAVAAVGIGAVMAIRGFRACANHKRIAPIEPTADDFIGE